MAVVPGVMGVSAFAPPLDEAGNSVKAQSAIKFIMNKLGLYGVSRFASGRSEGRYSHDTRCV